MCVCNTRERCTLHRTAEASAAEVNVHTELTREVIQGYWPSSGTLLASWFGVVRWVAAFQFLRIQREGMLQMMGISSEFIRILDFNILSN